MRKNVIRKFIVCLTAILMIVATSTTTFAQAATTDLKEEKKIVRTVEFTNEELLTILEEQNFDKELVESYKKILGEEELKEMTSNSGISLMAANATPNFIYWYADGSFEIGLNKETLRWGAVIGTAGFVGVLAAIPGVGPAVAAAISGTILGYASATIPKGLSFAFKPYWNGKTVVGYISAGVFPIAGY